MGAIVFAAGGTGGHVSPAVALAQAWQKLSPEDSLYILGGSRAEEKDFDFPGEAVNVNPPQRPTHLSSWYKLFKSYCQAKNFLKEKKVIAVIGTGGYACFPTVWAAQKRGIPYWLLDANLKIGRVVKLLGSKAIKVIGPVGCKENGQDPLGNPVREAFEHISDAVYDNGPLHVLVSGGSGGAQTLDQRLPSLLNKIHRERPLKVTHITRRDAKDCHYDCEASTRPPGNDFLKLLKNCHVLVGRAGGSTIAECNAAGRPQVLIPLPTAKDDHQRANARVQVKAGAAILLEQSQSDEEWLKALKNFFNNDTLHAAAQAARRAYPRRLAESLAGQMIDYLKD